MKGKPNLTLIGLVGILGIGLLLRTYQFSKAFYFAHDQDLYSWIAKDIVVNHHQRLVGQITSVDGVFIGGFYYYLMAVFYWLGKMNPLAAEIPVTIIGVLTTASIYWITKKHFGERSGLVAAVIYGFSFGIVTFDRWSVPTQPTLLWSIWFIEAILEIQKGNLRWLPLYGFLVAFLWQVHIALLPVAPLPIVAFLISGNKLSRLLERKNLKVVVLSVVVFLITASPFFIFEIKHNFSQVKSIIIATRKELPGPTGWLKLKKVLDASGREIQQRLLIGWEISWVDIYWIFLLFVTLILVIRGKLKIRVGLLFWLWIGLIMLAQFTSKRQISEYYFTNLAPIYIILLALFLVEVFNRKMLWVLVSVYLGINIWWAVDKSDVDHSLFYRMKVVDYIKNQSVAKGYPCIAVNFIADPGVGVGFRYLFWYKGVKLVRPGTVGVPVFNVPIPWQISRNENPEHFGRFGILMPVRSESTMSAKDCEAKENQLDPLLGYTD